MSKEAAAAILTQIYFQYVTTDAFAIPDALPEEPISPGAIECIGRVHAIFLRDFPHFEELARLDSGAEKEQDLPF